MNLIRSYLTGRGYTLPSEKWDKSVALFLSWYRGSVGGFHSYYVFNGTRRVKAHRYSMQMAKRVCEEHAALLLNERVNIQAEGFDDLPEVLERLRFFELGNKLVERAYALGTGAFVEYRNADGLPCMDFVAADMIYPLRWEGDAVTECAFASHVTVDGKPGYYVQIHTLSDDQTYRIENAWLNEDGRPAPPQNGVETVVETGCPVPLFQLFAPAAVNNLLDGCPMGMSIFGNAIDCLKAVDELFTSYVTEFTLGRKRLMVPLSKATIQVEQSGRMQPRFDPSDALFYVYEQSPDGKSDLKETGGSLRANEHETGLQSMLDAMSAACGLGYGYFKVRGQGAAKTATEVISEKSDLYQTMKRNEKPLERAVNGMVRALAYLCGKSPEISVTVTFDNSIVEDAERTMNENIRLCDARLRSRKRAVMEIDHVDEEEAERRLADIAKEQDVSQSTVEDFILGGERA